MRSKVFALIAAVMARLTSRRADDEDPTLGLPDYGDTQPHLHRMPSAPRRWPFESQDSYYERLARFYADPQ